MKTSMLCTIINVCKALADMLFPSYLQDPSKQVKPALIAEACKVVDVLGDDFRLHLIDRYVAMELKDYRRIFRPTEEAGQLDNISRRFAWFKRLLQTHELEQGRVFPGEWRVGWFLLVRFTEITRYDYHRYAGVKLNAMNRQDVTALLAKAGSNLSVKSLLDNLQLTVEFESTMAKKWATSVSIAALTVDEETVTSFNQFKDIMSTVAVTQSYAAKPMSSAFEPHMGIFVDAQERYE